MGTNEIAVRRTKAIFEELEHLQDSIRQRAFDLFRERGDWLGGPLANWLTAEREMVWTPAIEVRQKDSEVEVLAATPGVEAKDLDVEVTPDDLLIQAHIGHRHTPAEGEVSVCEFKSGQLFRSIHFPQRIDTQSVKADYRNGMLHLTAAVAASAAHRVDVTAG